VTEVSVFPSESVDEDSCHAFIYCQPKSQWKLVMQRMDCKRLLFLNICCSFIALICSVDIFPFSFSIFVCFCCLVWKVSLDITMACIIVDCFSKMLPPCVHSSNHSAGACNVLFFCLFHTWKFDRKQ